jgi:hypothetical protein
MKYIKSMIGLLKARKRHQHLQEQHHLQQLNQVQDHQDHQLFLVKDQ